ncbi:MAG: hypothetical protein WCD86_09320 [Ktedonobacteraceae bacterium]
MRIDTLPANNRQTQGVERRAWLRAHSPAHLEQCAALLQLALAARPPETSRSVVVLGAGACTEVPLAQLARAADEVTLVDLDLPAMQRAREELAATALQKRVQMLERDLSGGISARLDRLLREQAWETLAAQGSDAVFSAAAHCLDQCVVPDPPLSDGLAQGNYGLAISALLMTQLFSYPLLDLLDLVQRAAPQWLGDQERHHGYQEAAQAFRARVIQAHLRLLRGLLDRGGLAVLLTDMRGFAFTVHGTDHDAAHRRAMPLVPRAFFDLVRATSAIRAERHWEWISDLPANDRPGRGYEVVGYVLE